VFARIPFFYYNFRRITEPDSRLFNVNNDKSDEKPSLGRGKGKTGKESFGHKDKKTRVALDEMDFSGTNAQFLNAKLPSGWYAKLEPVSA
tara:strand:+ start:6685 stop:6954 length:270 start_codon:yes stop_codon:yes gene_type:complete